MIGPKQFEESFQFVKSGKNEVCFCDEDVEFFRKTEEGLYYPSYYYLSTRRTNSNMIFYYSIVIGATLYIIYYQSYYYLSNMRMNIGSLILPLSNSNSPITQ